MTQINISMKQKHTHLYIEETCDCQEEGRLREGSIGSFGLEANHYM